MIRRRFIIIMTLGVLGLAVLPWAAHRRGRGVVSSAPLASEVYVWQRAHTAAVQEALASHGGDFSRVVLLAGQIAWHGQTPSIVRVDVDWPALAPLAARGTKIGLALRIGELRGVFSGVPGDVVAGLAEQLVKQASAAVPVSELQIDFDCPTRRLGDYEVWVRAIRQRVSCPVVITALPTWLNSPAFEALARSADGFVLQVHSLAKPQGPDAPATLCDTVVAMQAVERAGRLGRPFRVALPTYGYIAAFDAAGRFVAMSAEGPASTWPEGVRTRQISADPVQIAKLVETLARQHPASLQGIIFYRLPVEGDRLNWTFPTLSAVMHGRTPLPRVSASLDPQEPGLVDIVIENTGDADAAAPAIFTVTLATGQWIAADALADFSMHQQDSQHYTWLSDGPLHIRPNEKKRIGWIRTSLDATVEIK